ncbi:MAG: hypothetical protein ABI664_05120, partial [bacterium]
ALKAFLSGERALRSWRLDDALMSYREAVRIDSSYAMAWYRQSFVQGWSKEGDGGVLARAMTLRLASQLPPRHALLLTALVARANGDYATAERGLLTLVQRYEDDADPWAELGEFRMHVGPLLGRPTTNAEAPLSRALALDSAGHPEVRYHLTQLALERGDLARARVLIAPLLPVSSPSDRTVRFFRVMLAMGDGSADPSAPLRTLREMPASDVTALLRIGMFSAGVTPLGRALVDSLVATPDSRDHRRAGLVLMQEMAIAQRRWSAAIAAGAALAALDSVAAADEWSMLATAMDAEIPAAEWRRAGDVLERAASGDTSALGWKRRIAAGVLAVRAGDASAYARRLSLLTHRARQPAWFTTELHVIRALHADVARDSLESARELDAIGPVMESQLGRWLRARSLERSGQLEAASAWYLSAPWGADGLVLTRAALEHASAIAAKRGNMADADTFARRAVRFGGGVE